MIHMASCLFMTGVILIIQLIHYPCFAWIDKSKFIEFHAQHTKVLGAIAGPGMLIELISAAWIARLGDYFMILNLFAVLLLWGITFLNVIPIHNQLSLGFEESVWIRLVKMNWFRTALWALRSLIFLSFGLWSAIR